MESCPKCGREKDVVIVCDPCLVKTLAAEMGQRTREAFIVGAAIIPWAMAIRDRQETDRLRRLARRLERRHCAPSLRGYGLAEGLEAAADLLDGLPGPIVHVDLASKDDELFRNGLCSLRELEQSKRQR